MSSKFESSVKHIPHSQTKVYERFSDLNNLEKVKDKIPADKVEEFSFDKDSISVKTKLTGTVDMRIVERDEPKCIKFETTKSPLPFFLWIQLLPEDENSCKMKLTIKAEINPFIKGMVSKPLQEAIEKIADVLANINYE